MVDFGGKEGSYDPTIVGCKFVVGSRGRCSDVVGKPRLEKAETLLQGSKGLRNGFGLSVYALVGWAV